MTVTDVPLTGLCFDATRAVHGPVDERVVAEIAAQLREGAALPPIVVFQDDAGTAWVGDGQVRALAAGRLGHTTIAADVRPGGQADALWHWFGANSLRAWRAPAARKQIVQHAILAFPTRSGSEIARQLGISHQWVSDVKTDLRKHMPATCMLPDVVTGKNGRRYPAVRPHLETVHPLADEIVAAVQAGRPGTAIAVALNVSSRTVRRVREAAGLGPPRVDRTRAAVAARTARVRTMATDGYTTRQIAADVRLSEERVKEIARRAGIDVTADRVVGLTRRHDPNRIVSRIVMDAENLTAGTNLIDYAALDRTKVPTWLRALADARAQLAAFIKRLTQEHSHHGEAA